MKSTQRGQLSEHIVMTECIRREITIAKPLDQQIGWDLLIQENGDWLRCQIKTIRHRSGPQKCPLVHVEKSRYQTVFKPHSYRKYKLGDFDILFAVDPDKNIIWKIPAEIAIPRWKISLTSNTFLWHPNPKISDFKPGIQENFISLNDHNNEKKNLIKLEACRGD